MVRKGGKEGGREEQGSQQAWRRGREEKKQKTKQNKDRQMERPKLVAATDPSPNKARNSKAWGPRAEHSSCSLDQDTTGWSGSELREEAEKACRGPRTRDSQSPGKLGAPAGECIAPPEAVMPRGEKAVRAWQGLG